MTAIPVRFSNLKSFARAPLFYKHAVTTGRADSAPMRRGRLAHWQTLGCMPDEEDGKVVIYEGERRGNAWKEFAAQHVGSDIVTRAEYRAALPIAEAVHLDPIASQLLDGDVEKRIMWKIGDRECSSRPDVIKPGEYLVDLKTTTDASPLGFQRQAWRMHYDAQIAFYWDAAKYHGIELRRALLIAVEVNAPHAVTVHELTPRLLEQGRRKYRGWFETLLVCESSNDFPGYAQNVVPFDVPEWFESEEGGEEEDEEEAA